MTVPSLLIVTGLLGAGLAYFLYMWKFDRAALENEPGDPELFVEHSSYGGARPSVEDPRSYSAK